MKSPIIYACNKRNRSSSLYRFRLGPSEDEDTQAIPHISCHKVNKNIANHSPLKLPTKTKGLLSL